MLQLESLRARLETAFRDWCQKSWPVSPAAIRRASPVMTSERVSSLAFEMLGAANDNILCVVPSSKLFLILQRRLFNRCA